MKLCTSTVPYVMACLLLGNIAVAEKLSPAAARLLDDVKYLASDELEGRGVGTEGLQKAADYIAEEFQKAGLNVTSAGGDPYQEFEITDGAELGEPNALKLLGPDGAEVDFEIEKDFNTCSFGGSGAFDAPIVFAGYGIEADDQGYNDYADLDVEGKVVIVMRRNPLQADPHGPFAVGHGISRHASLSTKVSRAYSQGAKAVLFVSDPYTGRSERDDLLEQVNKATADLIELSRKLADGADETGKLKETLNHLDEVKKLLEEHDADPLMKFGYAGTRSGSSPPIFHITQAKCNELLGQSLGLTLNEIEAIIDRTGKPFSRELSGWQATGEASLEVIKVPVKNVIGVLEGNGPHKDETIVIGAHFDHLGRGGEGSLLPGSKDIHNGADDNASGTAGLLELARRFGANKDQLTRRMVFIAFTGEERGLLGSEEYVKEPLYPLESTVAMFNMDMIGRMEEGKLTVFGTGTSDRWNPLLDAKAKDLDLQLSKKEEGFGPSDHSSFYAKQIPVLHFFTGTHSDYHRPSDDWDKVNAPDMETVVNLIEGLVNETLSTSERPKYIAIKGRAMLQRTGSRPYFGSIPDFGSDAKGYAIQGASPGSPADKAGIKGGDVIIRLGKNRVGGLDDFDLALREFKPGEQVDVIVIRDGEEVTLKVTLATPRN